MRDVHPLDRAQRDIDIAMYAAIVSGTITLVLILLVLMADATPSRGSIVAGVEVSTSYALAFAIAKRSRAAAIGALLLLAWSTLGTLTQVGFPSGLLGAVVFGYCYVRGIRGTYSHRAHVQSVERSRESGAPAA